MDKEQINELKPGDEVLIRSRFEGIKENGNFNVSYLLTTVHGKPYIYKAAVHPSAVIIKSQPKHDPTRLFKKGDKVKPTERHGRKTPKLNYKAEYTVTSSEDDYGTVGVEYFNGAITVSVSVPFYWLDLVTPVEELEPYKVWDTTFSFNVGAEDAKAVFYYGADMSTCPYTKEQAKAAAEAERDRLNAEHRKEAANG